MSADPAVQAYCAEAQSWDVDRADWQARTSRRAWLVAVAGWLCALGCALALAMITPLKRVDPFVIRVDNSTGIVDVVPVYAGSLSQEQTVTRYFLTHYITVCERFNFITAESDYEECGAFHNAARNASWNALWSRNNPASPLNLHRDGSSVRSEVVSVSFFNRANGVADLAQVRYLKAERPSIGAAEQVTHWIASIQYSYSAPANDARQRSWNPLGFRVIALTAEPEAAPQSPAVSQSGHSDGKNL